MSTPIRLTLILSEFVEAYRAGLQDGRQETQLDDPQGTARSSSMAMPALELMLGRGVVTRRAEWASHRALGPLQQHILEVAGLQTDDVRYASAPLCWLGQTGERLEGTLLHAQLVHFATGVSDVALRGVPGTAAPEIDELMQSLVPLVGNAGVQLRRALSGAWYLQAERVLDLATCEPRYARANGLYNSMPTGEDARALRLLMSELQMALHEHPANRARERQGVASLNAVWFWGAGALRSDAVACTLPRVFSDEAYVKGLWRVCGSSAQSLPQSATQLLASLAASTVVVPGPLDVAATERGWLAPAIHALKARRLDELVVRFDEWALSLTRAQVRRFWKPSRPLATLDDVFNNNDNNDPVP